jgi:uncharacterized protein (TIGR01777 family)
MDVAITGSSGLIGTALHRALSEHGHRPIRIVRRPPDPGADEVFWKPSNGEIDGKSLEGVDAVVNLAGAGIGDRRWTNDYRQVLVESRVNSTALLAATCAGLERPPSVFLSGSAIGYYGDRGSEELTETSAGGSGFLADLCQEWEAAAQPAMDAGIRTAYLRTGIVYSTEGGALSKLVPLFKLGLGGKFGDGAQYVSWIHIDDEVSAIIHLLEHGNAAGPFNLTAPTPVTNAELVDTLGDVLGRPTLLPVPAFGPQLILGKDRANSLLFESQRVVPAALKSIGYEFEHQALEPALRDLLD